MHATCTEPRNLREVYLIKRHDRVFDAHLQYHPDNQQQRAHWDNGDPH